MLFSFFSPQRKEFVKAKVTFSQWRFGRSNIFYLCWCKKCGDGDGGGISKRVTRINLFVQVRRSTCAYANRYSGICATSNNNCRCFRFRIRSLQFRSWNFAGHGMKKFCRFSSPVGKTNQFLNLICRL